MGKLEAIRQLTLVGAAEGRLLHASVGTPGMWTRSEEAFFFVNAATAETVRLEVKLPMSTRCAVLADGTCVVAKVGDALQLVTASGVVATAEVATCPPSPFVSDAGRPQWDGFWLASGGDHLWYAGYDEAGAPLLYLFETTELRLLDQKQPLSGLGYPRPEEPIPIAGWGDFGADMFCGPQSAEPVGLFGNYGDSFGYVGLFDAPDDCIRTLSSEALERRVNESSDQVVYHIALMPGGGRLLACDDLGFFSVIDIESASFAKKTVRATEGLRSDEVAGALAVSGFSASPLESAFVVGRIQSDATHIWVEMEVNEYADEEEFESLGADFPTRFAMRFNASFEAEAFISYEQLSVGLPRLLGDGLIAVKSRRGVELFRL